jgi:arylsulfatase A-like enzyme
LGIAASGLAHLMLFTGIFLALGIVLNLARAAKLGPAFEYWTLVASSGLALATVLDVMAFAAVGFGGPAAWIAALALGLTIACVWSGIARHRAADRSGDLDALDGFLAPVHIASSRTRVMLVALLPLLAVALAAAVEKMDWDFLLQKLGVLVLWLLAFALMHARVTAAGTERRVSLTMPVLVLVVFWLASYGAPRVTALTGDARLKPEFALDRYAAVDPSFHFLQDVSRANSADAVSFYGYLKAHSTISRDGIKPVDIDLVRPLEPPKGERPHIFLFILDSLRRDYISPYNPRVAFTPAIGRFARESFVFDRAFTRYGATGLSVPSIWVGGMTLHIQYIQPFTPMNTLMKLLDAGGYRRMMGMDTIAVRILGPTPFLTEIDRGIPTKDYDFCRTLGEMGDKLVDVKSDSRPVFGYTLPQNLHIANAFDKPVPPGESYPGFFERVAAPVHRIDACFGTFIDRLKTLGLYDNSIVILTADHGDSLGEEGRWGHSYTVFPEVMRVPLIMHVPSTLAGTMRTDLTRVSFLTDITPTLYGLLGYQPADLGALYGSPLFSKTPDESFRRRDPFLLASSYGAVYGMLRHNGRSLYIADAVEGRDYAYDLADGNLGRRVEITEAMRALNWDLIRKEVGKIADQYHFTPEP